MNTKHGAILFSIANSLAALWLLSGCSSYKEHVAIDPTPISKAELFDRGSSLVYEAKVLDEDGTALYVKPIRLWKGNSSDIETRLGIGSECQGYFKTGETYLFLLAHKSGGSFLVDPCDVRSINLSKDSDLGFLNGRKFTNLTE